MSSSASATSLEIQNPASVALGGHESQRQYTESGTHSVDYADEGDGRMPVTLTWRDVKYVAEIPAKKILCKVREPARTKTILSDMTGVVRPGEFLAIMGPSGAGKSSFINILAGKYEKGVSGEIHVNNTPVTRTLLNKCAAIVAQDDLLIPTMTPFEILVFSARLRLPKTWSYEMKMQKVEAVIAELGLQKCRDTRIGSVGGAVGVSGGERKRVSIAVELLTNPSLLIVDEPTSGLDSTTAESVVRSLLKLAHSGRTVICTIHQPSSQIYALFDKLLLITRGRTAYFGKAGKAASTYFAEQGFPCPAEFNPSDHFLKLLAEKNFTSSADGEEDPDAVKELHDGSDSDPERGSHSVGTGARPSSSDDGSTTDQVDVLAGIIDYYANSALAKHVLQSTDTAQSRSAKHAIDVSSLGGTGVLLQSWLLLKRAFVVESRTPILFKARLFQIIFLGLVVGVVFNDIDLTQTGYQDRTGSLFFLGVQILMTAIFGNLQTLPSELPLFKREHSNGMYGVAPYYFSKVIADIPTQIVFPFMFVAISYYMIGFQASATKFLNAAFIIVLMCNAGVAFGFAISAGSPTGEIALVIGPLVVVVLLLFAGLFRNVSTLPTWLGWLQYISPVRWGYELLVRNEFSGLKFECPAGARCAIQDGEQAIEMLGFNKYPWYEPFVILVAIMVAVHLIGLFFMYLRTRVSRK